MSERKYLNDDGDRFLYRDGDGDRIEVYDVGDDDGGEAALTVDVRQTLADGAESRGIAYLPVSAARELREMLDAFIAGEDEDREPARAEAKPLPVMKWQFVEGPREPSQTRPANESQLAAVLEALYEIRDAMSGRRVQVQGRYAGDAFSVPVTAEDREARWLRLQGGAR